MRLLTFTRLWTAKKRMYSINDIRLPQPVDLVAVGIFLLVGIVWFPLLFFIGVPLSNGIGLAVYLSVPVAAGIFGNKPIFDGKNIFGYLRSQITYLNQPKVWNNLRREDTEYDTEIRLHGEFWTERGQIKKGER